MSIATLLWQSIGMRRTICQGNGGLLLSASASKPFSFANLTFDLQQATPFIFCHQCFTTSNQPHNNGLHCGLATWASVKILQLFDLIGGNRPDNEENDKILVDCLEMVMQLNA